MTDGLYIPRFGERRVVHKPDGCTCSIHSAFLWATYPRPSIFLEEKAYRSFDGRSMSQIQTANVDAKLEQYGRGTSIGWVAGTGPVQDPKKLAVLSSSKRSKAQ